MMLEMTIEVMVDLELTKRRCVLLVICTTVGLVLAVAVGLIGTRILVDWQ